MKKNNIILSDCFPFRGNGDRVNFDKFIKGIYGGNVSAAKLDSLHNGVIGNSMPRPNSIEVKQMSANILGAYRSNKIYINRQIVSDSLLGQESCFILLLALLHEYGHFLDEHLNGPPSGGDPNDEKGKAFAERFIRYSAADLFNKPSFEFADFKATDDRGNEYVRTAKISSLSCEQRKGIFSFFEYSEYTANGDLELPGGEIISNAEFFFPKVHMELTEKAAWDAGLNLSPASNLLLKMGSIWPDYPLSAHLVLYAVIPIQVRIVLAAIAADIGTSLFNSHLGENQHWHSMCPSNPISSTINPSPVLTNEKVKDNIIKQAEDWYSKAIGNRRNSIVSLLNLGRLCHMIQDSYSMSHCWRRYIGDTNTLPLLLGMNGIDDGKIWTFQGYEEQDRNFHGCADKSTQEDRTQNAPTELPTIGYASAKEATKKIIKMYADGNNGKPWSALKNYLSDEVYAIHPDREGKDSGECHPLFLKGLDYYSISDVENRLSGFSISNPGM